MFTPNEIGSWFSTWTLVLTYIFILWTKIGRRGGTLEPLRGDNHPKYWKKCFGSCDISIESPWKALFKYVNQMLIWPLIRPSAAENFHQIVFFIAVLMKGACPHQVIGNWILVWTLVWLIFSYTQRIPKQWKNLYYALLCKGQLWF